MNQKLFEILVCPICKGPLQYDKKNQELECPSDKIAFPIRDGIAVMLTDQARDFSETAKHLK